MWAVETGNEVQKGQESETGRCAIAGDGLHMFRAFKAEF